MKQRSVKQPGLEQVCRVSEPWYRSPIRVVNVVLGTLVALVVVVVGAVFVVPRLAGGISLTVLTGSMQPTISPGDVVVVSGVAQTDVCSTVKVGQVITYTPDANKPDLITHRVVSKQVGTFEDGTSCRLITQGDANSMADEPVSPGQVRGVLMYVVPKLGWVRQWMSEHSQMVMIAGGLLFLGYLVWGAARPTKTRVVAYTGVPATDEAAEDSRHEEYQLRLRELEARERTIALREAELARPVARPL